MLSPWGCRADTAERLNSNDSLASHRPAVKMLKRFPDDPMRAMRTTPHAHPLSSLPTEVTASSVHEHVFSRLLNF